MVEASKDIDFTPEPPYTFSVGVIAAAMMRATSEVSQEGKGVLRIAWRRIASLSQRNLIFIPPILT
jgi:hypothetical protein